MPLSHHQVKHLASLFVDWAARIEALDAEMATTSGDIRAAYVLIRNDYLFKLHAKVGQLYHYVCGVNTMDPYGIAPDISLPENPQHE